MCTVYSLKVRIVWQKVKFLHIPIITFLHGVIHVIRNLIHVLHYLLYKAYFYVENVVLQSALYVFHSVTSIHREFWWSKVTFSWTWWYIDILFHKRWIINLNSNIKQKINHLVNKPLFSNQAKERTSSSLLLSI